jgi:glycosyl hydrolase family 16
MIAFAFCLVFLAAPTKVAAQSSGAQWFTAFYPGDVYEFDMDEWNSTATDCIAMNDGPGFTVTATSTIHTTKTGADGIGEAYKFPSGEANDNAFHTYGIVWSANKMAFFVDNPSSPFFTVTPSSFLREIRRHSMPISSCS